MDDVRRGLLGAVVGLAGVALGAASLVVEGAQAPTVTIRVYDGASLPPEASATLRGATESALAQTGIAIRWLTCAHASATRDEDCDAALAQHDVVVRVIQSHDELGDQRCGFALSTSAGHGFISLARDCAAITATALARPRQDVQPAPPTEAEVLGYTLAHELAHVLLPGAPHSHDGIFRARLERKQWNRLRHGGLAFLPEDIVRLREAVSDGVKR